MKIVFVSGFLNNHLLPLCEELNQRSEFTFISTQDWKDTSFNREALKKSYLIEYYLAENKKKCEIIISECDVALFGGSSSELLELRKTTGKLSFIYTERLFKKGTWRRFIPSVYKINRKKFIEDNDSVYVLCASSYVPKDLALIGFDISRCFRFGYFPFLDIKPLDTIKKSKQTETLELLYVGRLLKLKRVQDVVLCAKKLKDNNVIFRLNIIGDGPERKKLERLVKEKKLSDVVVFHGQKKTDEVFELMRKSRILFITSNYYEGWGTVVNEALSNGCAVIGSRACGSVAYLIKDGYNGFSYRMGNVQDMYEKTMTIIQSNDDSYYENAYNTIMQAWNAQIAAERIISISKQLLNDGLVQSHYSSGPMSSATD